MTSDSTASARPVPGGPADDGDPRDRLSRFDGSTFRPVTDAGITARPVHVVIPGWQTALPTSERLQAVTGTGPPRPVADPLGRVVDPSHFELLEALAALGEDHCVLHYSWIDEYISGLDRSPRSRRSAQVNGRRLALALQQVLLGPDVEVHLIGHGLGASVAVHAATALLRPPHHLTLLDLPGPEDHLLARIEPGRRPGRPFVDTYTSRARPDRPMPAGVVGVSLGGFRNSLEWYTLSVRDPGTGTGYGWSPLRDTDVSRLAPAYRSRYSRNPLALRRRYFRPAARRPQHSGTPHTSLALSDEKPTAAVTLHVPPGPGLIEFDITFTGARGDERLLLSLDGVPVFTTQARHPVPRSGRYIALDGSGTGGRLLTARLTTGGQPVQAAVTGITVLPEPTSDRTEKCRPELAFALAAVVGAVAAWVISRLARPTD